MLIKSTLLIFTVLLTKLTMLLLLIHVLQLLYTFINSYLPPYFRRLSLQGPLRILISSSASKSSRRRAKLFDSRFAQNFLYPSLALHGGLSSIFFSFAAPMLNQQQTY